MNIILRAIHKGKEGKATSFDISINPIEITSIEDHGDGLCCIKSATDDWEYLVKANFALLHNRANGFVTQEKLN